MTEGEDKPLKYPSIFARSELMVLTKTDLLPYVPFDAAKARKRARCAPGDRKSSRSRVLKAMVWSNGSGGWMRSVDLL